MRHCACLPLPDCLAIHTDLTGVVRRADEIASVVSVNSPFEGDYIRVRFRGGGTVKYCPATAAELARRFPDRFSQLAILRAQPIGGDQ